MIKSATESQEQAAFFQYVHLRYPYLPAFHIANESVAPASYRIMLRRTGLLPGVADIFVPLAANNYHGLFIEMKNKSLVNKGNGALSLHQRTFRDKIKKFGYKYEIAFGCNEAINILEHYKSKVDPEKLKLKVN